MTTYIADEALRIAKSTRRVIPLHSISAFGTCTCARPDCASPGKHPRTSNGLKDASSDVVIVAGWWRRWPTANIGLLTGASSRLIVIDLDGDDGIDTFTALQRLHGPIPTTRWARTGSGGWHAFFQHPGGTMPNTARRLGPGVDTRGDGGYVVVPPSTHYSGGTYRWWNDVGIAPLPDWLLHLLRPPAPPRPATPIRRGHADAYAAAAVAAECQAVSTATAGSRNHTLNAAAFSLGTLVGAGRLQEATARLSLLDAAVACGLGELEAERTISSGLGAGARHPREVVA